MTSQRWMLVFCFSLTSVLGTVTSVTTETQKHFCRTFGSGVLQPFNGSSFHVRSNCPFTLTRFTHNRVECDITVRRGDNGLLAQVEIIINKVRTVVQNGNVLVERKSVSLPYDHTYQHIFRYGVYTRLKSSLLPLSITWHNVPGGIDTLWLEQELSIDMTGLCGKHNVPGNKEQLIERSVISEDRCQIRDPVSAVNSVCRLFISNILDCLQASTPHYIQLCEENIHSYETGKYVACAFFKEVVQQCGNRSYAWNIWRALTNCEEPSCPGDLVHVEQGPAFVPSCSNPDPTPSNQELITSCVCPEGKVLNDHGLGFQCVSVSSCPCVFAGKNYSTGEIRSTRCQSCVCDSGKWHCSTNLCPARCVIEGQFVTTFDGKQYALPGRCKYVAAQGLNWTVTIVFSAKAPSLTAVILHLFEDMYTFSHNVKFGSEEIGDLHQSDHAVVFWQSSMYVQVHTSFGMKILIQMSPEIQLYITPPRNQGGMISGLCGNSNNDTTDDFTTSSRIIENSVQLFALSWSVGACPVNIPRSCINIDNEIYADEKCSVLNDPTGIFANCHGHIPTDHYHTACIQRTCNCGSSLPQCVCVALGSYAKACASLGVVIGDWRKAVNCSVECQNNQEFSYNMRACNHTCRSLSGPDIRCALDDAPVEGCGCPEGTHLNQGHTCSPKSECPCQYYGGSTPPGPVIIEGRNCICENGELHCSPGDCGRENGKVRVHCSEHPVNTAQKTCDSLSKPTGDSVTCESGCYCPHDQYEDHRGNCVSVDNCTCMYSGKVLSAGELVKTNCKTCICGQGQWHCEDQPCPGKCQVYGNGHYQTFDSKWYRFDGQCQYILVEDDCGNQNGSFSIRVESVPCCDEALTCSRSIILDLQGKVTLTLSDMKVTRHLHEGWTLLEDPLYSTHTVGLYIVISVPSRGITLIWDKHTRITIELHAQWRNRVCGLCGNFDSSEVNDLQISGSPVVSSPLAFGNSWKAATPPCSDVTTEIFPCERNSYCSAWAQRRCMILTGDTFSDCHLKVDPAPYYHACVQESCSCEFEGKFLGFCTAVAAYAEACSDQDVCVKWRTPDLCPVYCDYYNEQGQCSWHYEACGEMLTCGKDNYVTQNKLEGCYPRCSKEEPYFDENTGECTKLRNCTCLFNDIVIQPRAVVILQSIECRCENGSIKCPPPTTTSTPTTSISTTETWTTTHSTTTTPTTAVTTNEIRTTTTPPTTSTPTTAVTTTEIRTTPPTTSTPTTVLTTAETSTTSSPTTSVTTTETWTTTHFTTSTPTTAVDTTETLTTTSPTTSTPTTAVTTTETTTTPPTTSTPTTAVTTTETTTTPPTTSTPTTSVPTTVITTTETSTASTPATSVPTTVLTTGETSTTSTPTTSVPTTVLTTGETSTTSTPTTSVPTTVLTTAETSTTSTPTTSVPTTVLTTAETSTTSTPTTSLPTTVLTTAETSTSSTPTTSLPTPVLTTAETSTTSTPTTSVPTTVLTTAETSTTSTATTSLPTPVLTTAETSTTSTATTSFSTTKTWTTPTLPTTATQMSTITSSSTTPNWSTAFSTATTPTTVTLVTTTEMTNATEITSSSTAVSSASTAASTQPTTTWTTESEPTETITTEPTTTQGEPTSLTPQSTTFATSATAVTTESPTTKVFPVCECIDLKRGKRWECGETWTEDCFHKNCTDGRIEMTSVTCEESTIPDCPRDQAIKVWDECCETWKCNCRCELYGDPHYISFQGVTFDFLDDCTYILVEERSPRHHLTIAVDNFDCVEGLPGSCVKGVFLKYQNNIATLSILPDTFRVQATLNNVTIEPPYEEQGFRFDTTDYIVSISLPDVRSYVSLSPSFVLVVNLAMEHFLNNTQGQCGVCGGGSCVRKGGHIEDDSCCDKTAYDWVYADPLKPACAAARRDVPCHSPTPTPTTSPCPPSPLCELLDHPVFSNCSRYVDLHLKKKNCGFDSCRSGPCSSLEQAAEECMKAGFCIDWRGMTNGSCGVACPEGLVYRECQDKLDDFCYGGVRHRGESLERRSEGCYCPDESFRAGNHSDTCVSVCNYCKGPLGEPKLPGEEWKSNCFWCRCNNQTYKEECVHIPVPPLNCSHNEVPVLVNSTCCGGVRCVLKTCSYRDQTYQVGDRWSDPADPCVSYNCTKEGIQTETRVCPTEDCLEEDRTWDDQHCCFACNQSCAPKVTNISVTVENCTAVMQMPVCQGQCVFQPSIVLLGDLQVRQKSSCCQEKSSESRPVTLQCDDLTARDYTYKHITSCECTSCNILR